MARSSYVYILLTGDGHAVAGCTVKHEMKTIINRLRGIDIMGWRVQRLLDGQYTESRSYRVEDFIND